MVIFHHGDAAEDKGEEVRGGAIQGTIRKVKQCKEIGNDMLVGTVHLFC